MSTPQPLLIRRTVGARTRWAPDCCPALKFPGRRAWVRRVVGYATRRRAATVLALHLHREHRIVIRPHRLAAHAEEACTACVEGTCVDDLGNPIPCGICDDIDYEPGLIQMDRGLDSWGAAP